MMRSYPFARLKIGSAAAIAIDPREVKVRGIDVAAFKGVVEAREAIIDRKLETMIVRDNKAQGLSEQAANCALDAFLEYKEAQPNLDRVRSRLELSAAFAIAALTALEEDAA